MSMLLVQTELQKVMNTIMVGDGTLTGLLPKRRDDATRPAVFDDVPQNQAFPYVVFGDFTSTAFRAKASPGEDILQTLNVYSDVPSMVTFYAIGDRLMELFGDESGSVFNAFPVVDNHVIGSWFESAARFRNPDQAADWVRRLELTFRMRVQNDP